jgi:omega-hydroxy-beta-dihydromenaquinone-9 sulfotransferase
VDRHVRRKGIQANLAALATSSRGEVLATIPMHVATEVRRLVNASGYVFDELLYRGWRDVEIKPPLFIVAPARSGTTMLYHQLAADPSFAAPTLGNTMIRSVSVTKLLRRLAAKQRRFILDARDSINKTMSALDDTHTLRIDRLEEDECLFNDVYGLTNKHVFFPTLHEQIGIVDLDDRPERSRRAVMRRYHAFLRRFMYLAGPERTYLGKNVSYAGRIGCLEQAYPGARYIHIVRDPVVQLPSALELIRAVALNAHGRVRPPEHPYWRLMADALLEQHRRLLAWERNIGPERWLTLHYRQLIDEPAASVRRVYEHFGLPNTDVALSAVDERAGEFRKNRRYTLADYGIAPEYVREQLADVYAAYGLDPSA